MAVAWKLFLHQKLEEASQATRTHEDDKLHQKSTWRSPEALLAEIQQHLHEETLRENEEAPKINGLPYANRKPFAKRMVWPMLIVFVLVFPLVMMITQFDYFLPKEDLIKKGNLPEHFENSKNKNIKILPPQYLPHPMEKGSSIQAEFAQENISVQFKHRDEKKVVMILSIPPILTNAGETLFQLHADFSPDTQPSVRQIQLTYLKSSEE